MKIARQQTRDRHEDRCERAEKLGQAMDTLPGKTLRDRTPVKARSDVPRSKATRLDFEEVFTSRAVEPIAHAVSTSLAAEFSLVAPNAKSVQVAGTFNAWNPTNLSKGADGSWHIKMDLKPGAYEYRLVVDGKWQDDPRACDSVANPYGSRNSIKYVGRH